MLKTAFIFCFLLFYTCFLHTEENKNKQDDKNTKEEKSDSANTSKKEEGIKDYTKDDDFLEENFDETKKDSTSSEPDTTKPDNLLYKADSITYLRDKDEIIMVGNVELIYQTTRITGGKVNFNTKTRILVVTENPVLYEGTDKVEGYKMVYNMNLRKGRIYFASTTQDQGYFSGERIRKVADKVLNVDNGTYTTCDKEEPDFFFKAKRMRVFVNDKVITKPATMYIRDTPVFWSPFWVFFIKKDRHSGFLTPRFGENDTDGFFVENAGYYFAPSDYWDATLATDITEYVGYMGKLDLRYKKRYLLDGSAYFQYNVDTEEQRRRWYFTGNHQQNITPSVQAKIQAQFLSDRTLLQQSDDFDTRMIEQLTTSGQINKIWEKASLNLYLMDQRYLDAMDGEVAIDEELPRVQYNLNSFAPFAPDDPKESKWYQLVYVSYYSYFLNKRQQTNYEERDNVWDSQTGLVQNASLSTPQKILKYMNFSPSLNYNEIWEDEDSLSKHFVRRGYFSTGLSANTSLYGLFYPKWGHLRAFRHTITPTVSHSYSPGWYLKGWDFVKGDIEEDMGLYQTTFGGHQSVSSMLSFSLSQMLDAKWFMGQEKDDKILNLLAINSSTTYDLLKERDEANDIRPWGDLSNSFQLMPNFFLTSGINTLHSLYGRMPLVQLRTDLTFQISEDMLPGYEEKEEDKEKKTKEEEDERSFKDKSNFDLDRPWNFRASFYYVRGMEQGNGSRSEDIYDLHVSGELSVTPKWRVSYSAYYSITEGQLVSQDYNIIRDLHCWEMIFTRSVIGDKWTYYIRFNIKHHPDVKIEKRGSDEMRF
ncbi:MAG: LPS-assembly protein LptD [Candidatus Coatesbacteria bacterium]|nr:LPS-assembly protein LptD [Candidatus Coatesbacteria bacterium]